MKILPLNQILIRYTKHHPVKTLFAYSLLGELLVLLFVFFAFLTTAEILLPGFISLRLNLTWYLFFLLTTTLLLLVLGKTAEITPPQKVPFEKSILIISSFWGLGVIGISLHRFPVWSIAILLLLFVSASVWAWKHLCTLGEKA